MVLVLTGCAATGQAERDGATIPFDAGTALDARGAGLGFDAAPREVPDGAAAFRDAEACASVRAVASRVYPPVDIIWVIDGSPSMDQETNIVAMNLNGFAEHMSRQSIDYHVIVVADHVEVPAPLGTDTERFLQIDEHVASWEGLSDLVRRFPDYAAMLRPNAVTHFVAVTDDESLLMSAAEFQAEMDAQLGRPYTFHAIASPPGSTHSPPRNDIDSGAGCGGPFGDAYANGHQYYELAALTSGLTFSICAADWSDLFGRLTEVVADVTPLPCRFSLPDPPAGEALNLGRINLEYTPTDGGSRLVPASNPEFPCDDAEWYLEGEDVLLCPALCEEVSVDPEGRIDILFGCTTIVY